jgi:hypothetical protein
VTFMGWRIPTKGPRRISVRRNAISKQKSAPPCHHHESTAPSTLTPRGSAPSPPVFPAQLLLTASGGFQRTSAADFLNSPNRVWSIGPSFAQTIFDRGSRRAKVRQSLLYVSFDGKEILADEFGSLLIFIRLGIQPSAGSSGRSRAEVQQDGAKLLLRCA